MPLSPLRVEIARALAGELLRGLSVWHSLRSSPGTCPTCPDAADDLWCPDLVVAVSAIERARAHRCDRVSERLDVCISSRVSQRVPGRVAERGTNASGRHAFADRLAKHSADRLAERDLVEIEQLQLARRWERQAYGPGR